IRHQNGDQLRHQNGDQPLRATKGGAITKQLNRAACATRLLNLPNGNLARDQNEAGNHQICVCHMTEGWAQQLTIRVYVLTRAVDEVRIIASNSAARSNPPVSRKVL